MEQYLNLSGKSGVETYEIVETCISVKFEKNVYTYSFNLAGKNNVDTMKDLARAGKGLNSYINKNVKNLYDK
jgi:hypothetical protein